MRYITSSAEPYMQALAASLRRDPASLEGWRCVHIAQTVPVPAEWLKEGLGRLKSGHTQTDADIVPCVDGDVLLVGYDPQGDGLLALADVLAADAASAGIVWGEAYGLDMFLDWRELAELLERKAGEASVSEVGAETACDAALSPLREVFAEARQARQGRERLQVMLVEDDPLTRRLVTGGFKDLYAFVSAGNAEEAMAHYLMNAPDIVFLDIGLPDGSGFDVLGRILHCDPEAYIVMFSGNSYLDNITGALAQGAVGFVAKPFRKEKMRHYIEDSALHHHKYA